MTEHQLDKANHIQQQINIINNKIHKYQSNIKYINRRIEKEDINMEIEASLPCNNDTLIFINNLIQTHNVELEFLKEEFWRI